MAPPHIIRIGSGAPDPAQVELAVAALRRGELIALPTETVYGIAARIDLAEAVERLRTVKGRPDQKPFTVHLADAADAARWSEPLPAMAQRLAARYWPGPITLVVPARDGGTVGLRVPARDFTRAVIRQSGVDLFLSSANEAGEPPLWDPEAIAARFGARVPWIFHGGPAELREASTVVRVLADRFEVLREGILGEAQIAATAGRLFLFVCTGNTCRSPMAAALFAREAAALLGCTPAELPRRGVLVQSAGIAAEGGDAASDGALQVMAELGIDLGGHRSQTTSATLLESAARVFAMTGSHRDRLIRAYPQWADRVQVLAPDGRDVQDPFLGTAAHYRAARDAIQAAVRARARELLAPPG